MKLERLERQGFELRDNGFFNLRREQVRRISQPRRRGRGGSFKQIGGGVIAAGSLPDWHAQEIGTEGDFFQSRPGQ